MWPIRPALFRPATPARQGGAGPERTESPKSGGLRSDGCSVRPARAWNPDGAIYVLELVKDGNDPGYALDEQGQGTPHFMERFAAALEYENCRDLIMPDIFTLPCYYKEFTSILGLV